MLGFETELVIWMCRARERKAERQSGKGEGERTGPFHGSDLEG